MKKKPIESIIYQQGPMSSVTSLTNETAEESAAEAVLAKAKSEQETTSSLDEAQALNTAVCYLCSMNADYHEVERFLTHHPEALLLEGTLPAKSARTIVEEQMRRCRCFMPACNENRIKTMAVLERGFEYYRGLEKKSCSTISSESWEFYSHQLCTVESDLRELLTDDMAMRNRLLECAMEAQAYQTELEGMAKQERENRSALAYLVCCRNSDKFARRAILEYQVGVTSVKVQTLENEHALLLDEIREMRQMQFVMLTNAFRGCRRHVCEATKKDY